MPYCHVVLWYIAISVFCFQISAVAHSCWQLFRNECWKQRTVEMWWQIATWLKMCPNMASFFKDQGSSNKIFLLFSSCQDAKICWLQYHIKIKCAIFEMGVQPLLWILNWQQLDKFCVPEYVNNVCNFISCKPSHPFDYSNYKAWCTSTYSNWVSRISHI